MNTYHQDRNGGAPIDEGQADAGRESRASEGTVDEGRVRGRRKNKKREENAGVRHQDSGDEYIQHTPKLVELA